MPRFSNKNNLKRRSKDKKQDNRIKKLESFVYKTIENKQINYNTAATVTSSGYFASGFINMSPGAEDGSAIGDAARVGNTITLLRQQVCMNFIGSSTDTFNQMRVLLVESMDGNQSLGATDVLQYGSYSLYGDLVFASPYTTKTNTNKRYKVHMDKSFIISGLPTKGGVPPAKILKHVLKWKNGKLVEFSGVGAVDATNHRLSIIVLSDSVSASHPTINFSIRSTYKDA